MTIVPSVNPVIRAELLIDVVADASSSKAYQDTLARCSMVAIERAAAIGTIADGYHTPVISKQSRELSRGTAYKYTYCFVFKIVVLITQAPAIKLETESAPGTETSGYSYKGKLSGEWSDGKGCNSCLTMENASYMADGLCPCGIHKHHYHCSECGRVVQIG